MESKNQFENKADEKMDIETRVEEQQIEESAKEKKNLYGICSILGITDNYGNIIEDKSNKKVLYLINIKLPDEIIQDIIQYRGMDSKVQVVSMKPIMDESGKIMNYSSRITKEYTSDAKSGKKINRETELEWAPQQMDLQRRGHIAYTKIFR